MKLCSLLYNRIKPIWSNQKGFTLTEAIATIAIFAIVVTPIAMVFQGALESSLETRDKLKGTQLAQQYVEAIELMEFVDLKLLVDTITSGERGVVTDTVATGLSLPNLPNGMTVQVDLHYSQVRANGDEDLEYNTNFNSDNYQVPSDIESSSLALYDMLLLLDTASGDGFTVFDRGQGNEYPDGSPSIFASSENDRVLDVAYEYLGENKDQKILKVDGGTARLVNFSGTIGSMVDTLIIYCNDNITDDTDRINTSVNVKNSTSDVLTVLVYESFDDKIQPEINVIAGNVSVNRGLAEFNIGSNTHRIYEVEVTVFKGAVGTTELAHVVTTILAR